MAETSMPRNDRIVIVVTPAGYSTRGQLFDAAVDGRCIVTRSVQPLLDGARVLLAHGIAPERQIALQHAGSDHDALCSTVGAAARLTVQEGERAPTFRLWKPSPRAAGSAPMRFGDSPARVVADEQERA
jgi:hypothetical protein